MELNAKQTLNAYQYEPVEFKLKFLTNQLQSQIFAVDVRFRDKWEKYSKENEYLKLQQKYFKDIEKAKNKKAEQDEKNKIITDLTVAFAEAQEDEKVKAARDESSVVAQSMAFDKTIELFKMITIFDDGFYPVDEFFWENADLGKLNEVVEFFRKSYKII